MAIRVGRWDCQVCGHKGILGPETHCPQCGAPRGKNVQFYLPGDSEEVQDEAKLKEAKAGVDWFCDYCGADNKAANTSCRSCGNPRTQTDKGREERVILDEPTPVPPASTPAARKQDSSQIKRKAVLYFGIIAIVFAVLFAVFRTKEVEVTVTGHTWERVVELEKYIPVTEEDWNVPAGGKLIRSFRAIHHYDQVLSGYETRTRNVQVQVGTRQQKVGSRDKGNGYFEDVYRDVPVYQTQTEHYEVPVYRSVPVFATKYQYEIYRWKPDKTLKAGGSDKTVKWPDGLPPENATSERVGERKEKYVLRYKDSKGKPHEDEVNFEFWNHTNDGDQLKADKNIRSIHLSEEEKGK